MDTGDPGLNYTCPKCACQTCDIAEIRAAGGFLSAIFDVQSRRFTSVTCTRCKYTELYQTESSGIGKILDFLTG
jgi:predicted nucleic-acid-binding Zn-ribbon protein